MTLSLAKSSWVSKEVLTSEELTLLATEVLKAPDATAGGTYAPSAPIIVNGSGALQLGSRLAYTSRSVARVRSVVNGVFSYDSTRWSLVAGGSSAYFTQTVTGAGNIDIEIEGLPNGATLDSVGVYLKGAAGHAGTPGTLPRLKVYQRSVSADPAAALTQIGSTATDPYTSSAVYQANHLVTASSLAHTIDVSATGNIYIARIEGEGGANFVAGLIASSLVVTCTVTSQSEW